MQKDIQTGYLQVAEELSEEHKIESNSIEAEILALQQEVSSTDEAGKRQSVLDRLFKRNV